MRFRAILAALVALLAIPAHAADKATFVTVYELDATDPTYCVTTGTNGDPFGAPIQVTPRIETSGSSTTVSAVTASSAPFARLAVGDQVIASTGVGSAESIRYITAKASDDSVTVNAAVNWDIDGGVTFKWRKVTCGTTAASGWIDVGGREVRVFVDVNQLNVTGGINITVEGKLNSADTQVYTIYPDPDDSTSASECKEGNATAARHCVYVVPAGFDAIRVGFEIGTADDGGGDAGANAESVSAHLRVVK